MAGKAPYEMEYETKPGSAQFLQSIDSNSESQENALPQKHVFS